MKKKITNKLVRDKIPNILMEQGKAFKAHPLHGNDFSKQLANKLIEEAIELKAAIENGIHLSSIEPLSKELVEKAEVVLSKLQLKISKEKLSEKITDDEESIKALNKEIEFLKQLES